MVILYSGYSTAGAAGAARRDLEGEWECVSSTPEEQSTSLSVRNRSDRCV